MLPAGGEDSLEAIATSLLVRGVAESMFGSLSTSPEFLDPFPFYLYSKT